MSLFHFHACNVFNVPWFLGSFWMLRSRATNLLHPITSATSRNLTASMSIIGLCFQSVLVQNSVSVCTNATRYWLGLCQHGYARTSTWIVRKPIGNISRFRRNPTIILNYCRFSQSCCHVYFQYSMYLQKLSCPKRLWMEVTFWQTDDLLIMSLNVSNSSFPNSHDIGFWCECDLL